MSQRSVLYNVLSLALTFGTFAACIELAVRVGRLAAWVTFVGVFVVGVVAQILQEEESEV